MSQRVILRSFGSTDQLKIEEFSPLAPGSDEVLIKVKFSGINFADIIMRLGLYPDAPSLPFTPGYEVSGEIESVGSEVKHLSIGDKVVAATRFGGYSSAVLAKAAYIQKVPEGLSLDKAAALPVNYATSFFALIEQARVRAGDKVLVDCASGGVGVLSVQLVQSLGAQAIGLTGSPHKKEFISKLGAEAFTHGEFKQSGQKVDVVLNSLGGASISEHFECLSPSGRIVCIGASQMVSNGLGRYLKALKLMWEMPKFSMMKLFNANKGVFGLNVLHMMNHPESMEKAFRYMGEHTLDPIVDSIFPAAQAGKAHQYIQERKAKGKVLLEWP